jgi:hypothetical protein
MISSLRTSRCGPRSLREQATFFGTILHIVVEYNRLLRSFQEEKGSSTLDIHWVIPFRATNP